MKNSAILDKSRKYRYMLERQWGANNDNFVNFILLNPSTADEQTDDPTIKACIKFAQNWKYDGIYVTNLFAFRVTRPSDLRQCKSPVGKLNDQYIKEFSQRAKIIVFAWGNHGVFLDRHNSVMTLIENPYCLGKTKCKMPKHPLYVKRNTRPKQF